MPRNSFLCIAPYHEIACQCRTASIWLKNDGLLSPWIIFCCTGNNPMGWLLTLSLLASKAASLTSTTNFIVGMQPWALVYRSVNLIPYADRALRTDIPCFAALYQTLLGAVPQKSHTSFRDLLFAGPIFYQCWCLAVRRVRWLVISQSTFISQFASCGGRLFICAKLPIVSLSRSVTLPRSTRGFNVRFTNGNSSLPEMNWAGIAASSILSFKSFYTLCWVANHLLGSIKDACAQHFVQNVWMTPFWGKLTFRGQPSAFYS